MNCALCEATSCSQRFACVGRASLESPRANSSRQLRDRRESQTSQASIPARGRTSSNIAESCGFCNRYCGWHTSGTIKGTNIKYSFVGKANRCPTSCAAQSVRPDGNAGVDGMISVIAHELEEANTDPNPSSGWVDSSGAENADKCAWTFGQKLPTTSTGAYFNMTLPTPTAGGSRNYLVQRNLAASKNKCDLDFVAGTQ